MAEKYYLKRGDQIKGPFSIERLRDLQMEGKLRPTDRLSVRDDGGWRSIEETLKAATLRKSNVTRSSNAAGSRSRLVFVSASTAVLVVLVSLGSWMFLKSPAEQSSASTRKSNNATEIARVAPTNPESVVSASSSSPSSVVADQGGTKQPWQVVANPQSAHKPEPELKDGNVALIRISNVQTELGVETEKLGPEFQNLIAKVNAFGGKVHTASGFVQVDLNPNWRNRDSGEVIASAEDIIATLAKIRGPIKLSLLGAATSYPHAAIARITSVSNLTRLHIEEVNESVNDQMCQDLSQFAELTGVSLASRQISNAGITALARLPKLVMLRLANTRIDNSGLEAIASHISLGSLTISDCPNVTDKSLQTIAQIPKLKSVRLDRTGVTRAAVRLAKERDQDRSIIVTSNDTEHRVAELLLSPIPGFSYPESVTLDEILQSLGRHMSDQARKKDGPNASVNVSFVADETSFAKFGWKNLRDVKLDGLLTLPQYLSSSPDALNMLLRQVWQARLDFEIQDDKVVIFANPPKERKGGVVGVGRGPWLSHEAFQQDFNVNSAAGLRVSEVFADYDSKSKQLRYSAVWLNANGNVWHVKHGISDEQLANDKARFAKEGYTTCKVGTAKMKGQQYHVVLWTRTSGSPNRTEKPSVPGMQAPVRSSPPQTQPAGTAQSAANNGASREPSKADFMRNGTEKWGPAFADVYKVQLNNSSASIVKIGTNRAGTEQLSFTVPPDWAAAGKKLTNEELLAISRLTGSVELNLDNVSAYTEQELAQLGQCQGLEVLTFRCDHDRNVSFLRSLSSLQNLKWLIASGEGIADPCTLHMRNLSHLTYLGMRDTKVTDNGIRVLVGIPSLEQLFLVNSQVRGDGFAAFKDHGRLQHIRLANCKSLDEKSMLPLSSIPSLKKLECYDTNLGPKAAASLKKARSTLAVEIKGANSDN